MINNFSGEISMVSASEFFLLFCFFVSLFVIMLFTVMLGIVSNRIREFNGDIDSLQRMGLTILVGDFYQVIQF